MKELQLISDLKSGTNQRKRNKALEKLYQANKGPVKKLVISLGGTSADCEEVLHEAIIIVFREVMSERFLGKASIHTYLYTIAKNLWLTRLKKQRQVFGQLSESVLKVSDQADLPDSIMDEPISLMNTIGLLSNECKEVLLDFYFHKESIKSIMLKFRLGSEGAAKNKKYRCLKKLTEIINSKGLNKTDFE